MKINFRPFLTGFLLVSTCLNQGNLFAQSGKKKSKPVTFDVSYLDKSVKPQDDFFRFANGTWIKKNPIPPSESRWGSFNELEQNNQKKLTELLENAKNGQFEQGSIQFLLGSYYASFMNMEQRNKLGLAPIKDDLAKATQLIQYTGIHDVVAYQHRYSIRSLFGFGVGQDLKNVNSNISYLSQGGIGLPNKDYYLKEDKKDILAKYEAYIAELFVLSGNDAASAKTKAHSIVAFETKLAQKMMSPAELRIPENSYNKFSKAEVEKMLSNFNLEGYLSKVGSQVMDTIVVGQPEFIKGVNEMVKSESLETWKNYLEWKTLNFYSKHLSEAFVKANFNFYQGVLSGKSQMKPINERAINELTGMSIGEALGQLFVEKHFSVEAKNRVNALVDNLLITFEERINKLDWMTDITKKEALTKLKAIGRKLGYPEKWEDFSDLKLNKNDYIGNIKKCNLRDTEKDFAELYKPIDKSKWGMPAHMVNAYYHPLLNEIAFPAGIMQAPFFDVNAEDAVNYGRIGMVIGHEFVHGFDDMGSKFAADGSFTNWWSEEDRKNFEHRTKLLGETFSNFCPIDGHCVNPDLTMGENIADLGGITLAYYAYMRTEEFKEGKIINGYNPAQRFFLSFAQLWKISYTNEELKNRIANDPHSPGMYRVNGPLMNCPEFFEAFGIKEGDAMRNSEQKLSRIW